MASARSFTHACLLSGIISFGFAQSDGYAQEQIVQVLTSIKPVHSLVSGVMSGVGEAELLLNGASSPHTYSLKPSQARSLQSADVIFWIGEELEVFLEKPLETLGQKARIVTLEDVPGLTRLPFREGGAFDAHEEDEEHEEQEMHEAQSEQHEHQDDEEEAHNSDEHDHGELDPHIWLDPVNAGLLVSHIASVLSEIDSANAAEYNANAAAMQEQLTQLTGDVEALLEPVADRPFVVFHDGYHYFEDRFGLQAAGSLTINPETMPGAARLAEIKQKLNDLEAACIFSEPQFQSRIIDVAREGTSAKAGLLDPLGMDLQKGPELYDQLIRNMAASFHDCLSVGS
ncbi:zinc ABC transporter substrate-binding protein [Pararhizobium sp. IMCC21322]|uniref:zinc ABC transporter substrate-binding protein n=1 Tax=Pararhizobium sp. IMCC21322 TaxID=3067903 RepID=UPI002741E273|nr:zinc ABC transporter substrate-binding protein [Pararhizobium sp. IMCC21322]